ncbi:MAG: hypothetical protein JSS96_09005 [Bacteroidetes bacterium]|nr:hypothetical protein [Bacteroidota bacterium]
MRIKVLMVGDDPVFSIADARILKNKNVLVYNTYNVDNLDDLIDEIRPNIIFINASRPDNYINTYKGVISDDRYVKVPVIYTLAEDNVYLVNKPISNTKERRKIIAESVVDAVKISLRNKKHLSVKSNSKVYICHPDAYYARASA